MLVTIATEPATPTGVNEDFVAATPTSVVLIDGVSTTGVPSGCIHGTLWYVHHLGGTLINGLAQDHDTDMRSLLADALAHVAEAHADTCDLSHSGTPSATVVLIRQHQDRLDHLVLADSTLLLSHDDETTVISDRREDDAARHCRQTMDALPNGTPEHKAARLKFMRTMQGYRNQPGGFWVAAANPDAASEALTGSTPLAGLRSVAALSDGATRLVDRFDLLDWTKLLNILATQGPHALIKQTRAAEHSDPAADRWKRGKATDDATVAYCTAFVN